MKKFLILKISALIVLVFGSVALSADYSKKSDKELIGIAGSMEAKDVPSYFQEVQKRMEEMTLKEAREFKEKIKAQEQKVFDSMKVKDFKARKKAIREEFEKLCKDKKESCKTPHKFAPHTLSPKSCDKNKHMTPKL